MYPASPKPAYTRPPRRHLLLAATRVARPRRGPLGRTAAPPSRVRSPARAHPAPLRNRPPPPASPARPATRRRGHHAADMTRPSTTSPRPLRLAPMPQREPASALVIAASCAVVFFAGIAWGRRCAGFAANSAPPAGAAGTKSPATRGPGKRGWSKRKTASRPLQAPTRRLPFAQQPQVVSRAVAYVHSCFTRKRGPSAALWGSLLRAAKCRAPRAGAAHREGPRRRDAAPGHARHPRARPHPPRPRRQP